MDGLSNFPPGGWEKLPNRLLDPEMFDDEEKQDDADQENDE